MQLRCTSLWSCPYLEEKPAGLSLRLRPPLPSAGRGGGSDERARERCRCKPHPHYLAIHSTRSAGVGIRVPGWCAHATLAYRGGARRGRVPAPVVRILYARVLGRHSYACCNDEFRFVGHQWTTHALVIRHAGTRNAPPIPTPGVGPPAKLSPNKPPVSGCGAHGRPTDIRGSI